MAKEKPIANLNCEDAAGKAIQVVLSARLRAMCAFRTQALKWGDPEGVHDMRVASRRLRSALNDFKPYLRKGSLPLARLKSIARSLGAVRDEDVVIEALEKLRAKVDEEVARGIDVIAEEHRHQRAQARSALERTIKATAITEFRNDFQKRLLTASVFSDSGGLKGANEILTFSRLEAGIIVARLKQIGDSGDVIYRPLRTKELHRMRILAKRLRYAVELFSSCWGDELKKHAAEIARLQTSLGELHDCDVWIANLGSRLKKNRSEAGRDRDPVRENDAIVWLLQHFVNERTKHYCRTLARWHKWENEGLLERLKAMMEADLTPKAEVPQSKTPI